MPLIFHTNISLIDACIFQNSFNLNLFQKFKYQNFKLPYKYLYVFQKPMGPFSFKEYFSKAHEIFYFWKMLKKSVVFSLDFCTLKIKLIFQNSFELFTSLKINFLIQYKLLFFKITLNFLIQYKLLFFKITMEFPLFKNGTIFVWAWQPIIS